MGCIVGVYIDIATILLHHEKKARNASAIGKSVTNKSKRTFISLICECQHTDMRFEGEGLPLLSPCPRCTQEALGYLAPQFHNGPKINISDVSKKLMQ